MASSTLRIPLSARVQGATSTHASGNTKALINSFVGKSDALAGALDVSSHRFSPLPPLSDGVTPAVSLMHLPLISSSKRRTSLRQDLPPYPNLNCLAVTQRPPSLDAWLTACHRRVFDRSPSIAAMSGVALSPPPEPRSASSQRDTWLDDDGTCV